MIGGAVVNRRNGHWYIQSRFLDYLLELEQRLGSIAFFASQYQEENPTFFPIQVPESIEVHIIRTGLSLKGKVVVTAQQLIAYRRAQANRDVVIHFFPAALNPATQLLLRKGAKKYLSYFKSDWIQWTTSQGRSKWKVRYWQAMEQLECRLSDVSVFRSHLHQQRLQSQCDSSTISQPILSVSNSDTKIVSKQDKTPTLLFIGMIAEEKGLRELIAALGTLVTEGITDFHLDLVGAPHKNALTASGLPRAPTWLASIITSANLDKKVTIHGFIDDKLSLSKLYSSATIFVLPSWSEGFPRVLDEAMSYSLPIITTRVGGIGEVLTNDIDALVLPPKDSSSLYLAIKSLLSDDEKRGKLGRAGNANYRNRVTDSAASQHVALLLNHTNRI